MTSRGSYPTPYPEVNEVLKLLLSEVKGILDAYFIGMYLYGSLAIGDFDPKRSDIDFLVVTADELTDEVVGSNQSKFEEPGMLKNEHGVDLPWKFRNGYNMYS